MTLTLIFMWTFIVFCTVIIHEIMSKLVFKHGITSLGSIRYCSASIGTEPNLPIPNTLGTDFPGTEFT
jgi:hypothetical protein